MGDDPKQSTRLAAGTRLGSYTITRCIGEGGMGVVYEGLHEGLGKRVAIKTLLTTPSAQSSELTARFVREGKAAAKIHHPNVVDVVDVSVHDGLPYLVMEYLEGENLGARMEHQAPMQSGAIADLMIPIISALAAAHEAGIVHRDLKPDNIFITQGKGGTLEPKLVDFGISKLQDGESLQLTGTNAILGTPYYMSPEQAGSSKKVDHRSDIFSFGVILYQCATHELPFKGDSLYKLLGEIMHGEPPPVRSLAKNVPAGFEAVITRAMQKDPAARFQSAAELGAALLPFASPRVRLSYEHELGSLPSAPTAHDTVPPRRGTWLLSLLLLLGALGAIAGWLATRGDNAHAGEMRAATPVTAQPTSAARHDPEPVAPSTQAVAGQQTRVPLAGDAATGERRAEPPLPAGVEARERPTSPRHIGTHPSRGLEATSARRPAQATPTAEPEHPTRASAPTPPASDDLFRDRK
jgi:serine/threonine-protein kinase